ncbi:Na/Pi cotransporter family protein [Aliiroseovarius sp. KMU-50]|uniref:Na/Pi cotransporter family protein n=1 Tax=Aliiroseovarius salicola TaxID=3009082 RepID=A0ABT4VZH8_9RHOB|nr:Na/Pi cotransporter family protein [Aliiroseovarius sp. KMU-50]MDA5093671.1 Na/Pi cotransporter family protein [Aliiroseovarius sp. KMU-50]
MAIISFVISLMGATMLLLFAVRMVRTGIERSFGASFKRVLTQNKSLVGSSTAGLFLAVVLQSSAAVALLTSGFISSGMLSFPAGLAIVLGGDLGSALIIQILSFKLDWLVPMLLAVGGWLFVKTDRRNWQQAGRILMGVAFILISLRFLREAMDPISDSAFLPAISGYLAEDFITAFICGAVLAFVMHSSVAAILMCVTLVQIGAIPVTAGLSLVLGANLGSGFIPVWLTRGMSSNAKQVPLANLVLRGGWALAALLVLNSIELIDLQGYENPGQLLIFGHLAFNGSLLIIALPFCFRLEGLFRNFSNGKSAGIAEMSLSRPASALDKGNVTSPKLAISSLRRELLRMTELVERMFLPALDLYEAEDPQVLAAVKKLDEEVNQTLELVRQYVAEVPIKDFSKSETKTVRALMDYAIRLESAGDVISKVLARRIEEKHKNAVRFSPEGWKELVQMHEAIAKNLRLACNVLMTNDLESARLLVIEKTEIKRAERNSRKRHLRRLQNGQSDSFGTSNIHLETLRALRDINSHVSAIAYPVLYKNGQLLETRLIMDAEKADLLNI